MTSRLQIRLHTTDEQAGKLVALQAVFAQACNALAAMARDSGVWSRVGLHHLGYRSMRAAFPQLGSQMVCNAVYSVSRACRLVYQHPDSPFGRHRRQGLALPQLRFEATAPVYFDRHTLSVRNGQASMYTLDGRMRFNLPLAVHDEARFRDSRLLEVALQRDDQGYVLTFAFADGSDDPRDTLQASPTGPTWPEYLVLLDDVDAGPAQLPSGMGMGTGATMGSSAKTARAVQPASSTSPP